MWLKHYRYHNKDVRTQPNKFIGLWFHHTLHRWLYIEIDSFCIIIDVLIYANMGFLNPHNKPSSTIISVFYNND